MFGPAPMVDFLAVLPKHFFTVHGHRGVTVMWPNINSSMADLPMSLQTVSLIDSFGATCDTAY